MRINLYDDLKVLFGYSATRKFKVAETRLSSGVISVFDYGYDNDVVSSSFTLMFTKNETDMYEAVLQELTDNVTITMECGDGEYVLGSEVSYDDEFIANISTVSTTRAAYERYIIKVTCVVINPDFVGTIVLGLSDILIPHTYNKGYTVDNNLIELSSVVDSFKLYNGDNIFSFNSLNEIKNQSRIKKYLCKNLRSDVIAIPTEWKDYLKVYEPYDLTYCRNDSTMKEKFPRYGVSELALSFKGVNE